MLSDRFVQYGSIIGRLAHDSSKALHWSLSNDIIYWYTKYYQTGDNMALIICEEKYNELANLMNWETV